MSVGSHEVDWLEVSVFVDFAVSEVATEPDCVVVQRHVTVGRFVEREVVGNGFPFTGLPMIGPELDGVSRTCRWWR